MSYDPTDSGWKQYVAAAVATSATAVLGVENQTSNEQPQPVPEQALEPAIDYHGLKVVELKAICRERNVAGFSKLNRAQLIETLTNMENSGSGQ